MGNDYLTIKTRSVDLADLYEKPARRIERDARLPTYSPITTAPKAGEKFDYHPIQYKKSACRHTIIDAVKCKHSRSAAPTKKERCLCACHIIDHDAT